jgi:hypothetical protein
VTKFTMTVKNKQTIKRLYTLALTEGEGVGTAYEYYAKRLVLLPWLASGERPKRMLIAGLPEKYGESLDFLLLGAELGCQITVVDDRHQTLARLAYTVGKLERASLVSYLRPALVQTNDLTALAEVASSFDLVVSSEVLQRLEKARRAAYVDRLQELAPKGALFAPNAENESHVGLSGLSGVYLNELNDLIGRNPKFESRTAYIDMPPFPPGITRSDAQRAEASTGSMEAFAMWGLGIYAKMERFAPAVSRRKWAHIVYGLYEPRQR